jgi:hypothetical protein
VEQGYAGEYVVHDWFVSDEDGVVLWHVALSPFLPFFTVWLKVFFLGINRLWCVLSGGFCNRFGWFLTSNSPFKDQASKALSIITEQSLLQESFLHALHVALDSAHPHSKDTPTPLDLYLTPQNHQ